MSHTCHWPGCKTEVPPAMWGCKRHWFTIPPHLRNKIWATYVPGQEITKLPSKAYVEAAKEVQAWIEARTQEKRQQSNTRLMKNGRSLF